MFNVKEKVTMKKFELYMSFISEEYLECGKADSKTVGDIASRHGVDVSLIEDQIKIGLKIEAEHTTNPNIAREIAMDHLWEDPHYYDKLEDMEKTFPKLD